MEKFINILRLISFVPIGAFVYGIALFMIFAVLTLFFDWTIQDYLYERMVIEKPVILQFISSVPAVILGYKVSHIIKPTNLTNKNFITIHSFFIGISFALNVFTVSFLYFNGYLKNDLLTPLLALLMQILQLGIFILMIKDRKYNLFNIGRE